MGLSQVCKDGLKLINWLRKKHQMIISRDEKKTFDKSQHPLTILKKSIIMNREELPQLDKDHVQKLIGNIILSSENPTDRGSWRAMVHSITKS